MTIQRTTRSRSFFEGSTLQLRHNHICSAPTTSHRKSLPFLLHKPALVTALRSVTGSAYDEGRSS
jgi:hypothetical protein